MGRVLILPPPPPELIERVVELYLESSEAQHGDPEIADHEARMWWGLFQEAAVDVRDNPREG